MIAYSNNGVMYFKFNYEDMQLLPKSFFNNKIFIKIEDSKEIWGYNYDFPVLLVKGLAYFGKTAKRDYFSENKEEIFKEHGLIENEHGIFDFDTYKGEHLNIGGIEYYSVIINGYPQIGDFVAKNKINSINGVYDIENNLWSGRYGF